MAFDFLGLFVDEKELAKELREWWPSADVKAMNEPFEGVALRIPRSHHFDRSTANLPDDFVAELVAHSRELPEARFLALRTECFGGRCTNHGRVVVSGAVAFSANDDEDAADPRPDALRFLVGEMGADIGPGQVFRPLMRDFFD